MYTGERQILLIYYWTVAWAASVKNFKNAVNIIFSLERSEIPSGVLNNSSETELYVTSSSSSMWVL